MTKWDYCTHFLMYKRTHTHTHTQTQAAELACNRGWSGWRRTGEAMACFQTLNWKVLVTINVLLRSCVNKRRNNGSAGLKGQQQTKACAILRRLPWKCVLSHASSWMEFWFLQWDNSSRFRLLELLCCQTGAAGLFKAFPAALGIDENKTPLQIFAWATVKPPPVKLLALHQMES